MAFHGNVKDVSEAKKKEDHAMKIYGRNIGSYVIKLNTVSNISLAKCLNCFLAIMLIIISFFPWLKATGLTEEMYARNRLEMREAEISELQRSFEELENATGLSENTLVKYYKCLFSGNYSLHDIRFICATLKNFLDRINEDDLDENGILQVKGNRKSKFGGISNTSRVDIGIRRSELESEKSFLRIYLVLYYLVVVSAIISLFLRFISKSGVMDILLFFLLFTMLLIHCSLIHSLSETKGVDFSIAFASILALIFAFPFSFVFDNRKRQKNRARSGAGTYTPSPGNGGVRRRADDGSSGSEWFNTGGDL